MESSHAISDRVSVKISVKAPTYENLLKHYDPDPFEKPLIITEREPKLEFTSALELYLSNIGIKSMPESDNQLNLDVAMCSINYLLGKGWTATVKLNIKLNAGSFELLNNVISGYVEAGGDESEFQYAEKAINTALFEAFESVNWEQLKGSFTKDATFDEASEILKEDQTKVVGFMTQKTSDVYYALIIAIEDYLYLNKLDQPIGDATLLKELLNTSYSFEPGNIIFLKNPTREEIINKLDILVKTVTKNDNLLIFYAGHGYWDEKREAGYWLPVDAKQSSTANWLRNSTIQEYIGDIHSKHTLLIADACFGGGIFKTRKAFDDAPSSISQMYNLASRKAITSGMLNEVPDRSVFFEYLLNRLNQNEQKYTSSLELFSSFRNAVMNNSDNVPQYGTIQKTGDEGGDFIFIKSK